MSAPQTLTRVVETKILAKYYEICNLTDWLMNSAESCLQDYQVSKETFLISVVAVVTLAVMALYICYLTARDTKRLDALLSKPPKGSVISIFDLAKTSYLSGHAQQVMTLVDKLQFDVNFPIPGSGMTLFLCACISGNIELMKFLLERGGDVSVTNKNGDTALYLATFACAGAEQRDIGVLELLCTAGCDLNRQNRQGNTALHWAASKGDNDVIRFLLTHGATKYSRNTAGLFPSGAAIEAGHGRAAKLLKISSPALDALAPTPTSVRLGLPNLK